MSKLNKTQVSSEHDWIDKEVHGTPATPAEIAEMEELLKEFRG